MRHGRRPGWPGRPAAAACHKSSHTPPTGTGASSSEAATPVRLAHSTCHRRPHSTAPTHVCHQKPRAAPMVRPMAISLPRLTRLAWPVLVNICTAGQMGAGLSRQARRQAGRRRGRGSCALGPRAVLLPLQRADWRRLGRRWRPAGPADGLPGHATLARGHPCSPAWPESPPCRTWLRLGRVGGRRA